MLHNLIKSVMMASVRDEKFKMAIWPRALWHTEKAGNSRKPQPGLLLPIATAIKRLRRRMIPWKG